MRTYGGAKAVAGLLLLAAPLAGQPTWTVAGRPLLDLRQHIAEFHRISGAATLPNGTVAVADEGDGRVLLFAPDGAPKGRVGRLGAGPGEFRMMIWLGSCSLGSVSIYDPALSRITDVDAAGAITATRPGVVLMGPATARREIRPYGLSCAPNGAIGAVGGPRTISPKPGPYRPAVPIGVSRVGPALTLIGEFPGTERYRWPTTEGPRHFGRPTLIATSPTRVFVGTADSFFVQIFDHAGAPRGSLRHAVAPKRLTADEREVWIQRNLERLGGRVNEIAARASLLAEGVLPEVIPAYERIIAEGERLWVEEGVLPTATQRTWWGFDEGGRVAARLTVPVAFTIYEIAGTMVLGKWTDEEGSESVRRYAMTAVAR